MLTNLRCQMVFKGSGQGVGLQRLNGMIFKRRGLQTCFVELFSMGRFACLFYWLVCKVICFTSLCCWLVFKRMRFITMCYWLVLQRDEVYKLVLFVGFHVDGLYKPEQLVGFRGDVLYKR